jgi:galactoside O-acetyltransferase
LRLKITTTILGHRNIVIGEGFVSLGHLYLYAVDGGNLEIGDNCKLNTNVQLGAASGRLTIGNYVMMGPNVVVRAADHGMARGIPMMLQPPVGREIVIEDDVWIGSNAVVTGGVRLATGTVVAAGAVVTRSTEPYSIVAGVPARKIGERA